MEQDVIRSVEIDEAGRLHVVPSSHSFPYVYREAMEVHWDEQRKSLYSPPPREWSYARWFQQIVLVAREQGCVLVLAANTTWRGVSSDLQRQFSEVAIH